MLSTLKQMFSSVVNLAANDVTNGAVQLVYILDRSGSMQYFITDAVGGFNAFVEEQRKQKGEAYLTLIAFDDRYEVIYDRLNIKDVPKLDVSSVPPRGMTALRDAVGRAISSFEPAEKVLFLIQTDGEENASTEYGLSMLKELIARREHSGWKFDFVGTGKGLEKQGQVIGINNARSVAASSAGYADLSKSFSCSASAYRASNAHDNSADMYAVAAKALHSADDTSRHFSSNVNPCVDSSSSSSFSGCD